MDNEAFKERVYREVAERDTGLGLQVWVGVRKTDTTSTILEIQRGIPAGIEVRLIQAAATPGKTEINGKRVFSGPEFEGLIARIQRQLQSSDEPLALRAEDANALSPSLKDVKEAIREHLAGRNIGKVIRFREEK